MQGDMDSSMIWDYYNGKTVFITGGTGFVGSALICRLLSQASPLRVYVLCRGGFERAKTKWTTLLPETIAESLLENDRITILDGDITEDAMGLTDGDWDLLRDQANIVIHAASSISLQSPLSKLSRSIIAPSLLLAERALEFTNLQRFTYISTAFSNTHLWGVDQSPDVAVKETTYPLFENEDPGLAALDAWVEVQKTGTSAEFETQDFPFAYAYAKHLTERLVQHKFSQQNVEDKLLIVRPSIIGPADELPYPGFSVPLSTPSTALAAGIILYPGLSMKFTSRLEDPYNQANVDEVPVDVVVDRLLVHLAVGTTGCVHAVSGEKKRLAIADWWPVVMNERRLPWGVNLIWTSLDWHSSELHPIARLYKIFGTSFAFAEDKTNQLVERLGEKVGGLRLFTVRSGPYSLVSRRNHIRYLAELIARKKGWPVCLTKLLCRPGETGALELQSSSESELPKVEEKV